MAPALNTLQLLPGTHVVEVQKVRGDTGGYGVQVQACHAARRHAMQLAVPGLLCSQQRPPLPHPHLASFLSFPPAAEFYKWYADLTQALASIVSKKQPGPAGDVGARAAAARRRAEAEAGSGRRRANAFELIATSFNVREGFIGLWGRRQRCAACAHCKPINTCKPLLPPTFFPAQVGALFEEAQAASRHVQFSSRRSQPEILDVLEAAAADLGGSAQRKGAKRCGGWRAAACGGWCMQGGTARPCCSRASTPAHLPDAAALPAAGRR